MPLWMLRYLNINVDEKVLVQSFSDHQKATKIKIKPEKTAFVELGNPKVILENKIKNYVLLTEGEDILINHLSVEYSIKIVKCYPYKVISTLEIDRLEIEFDEPADYKQHMEKLKKKTEAPKQPKKEEKPSQMIESKQFAGVSTYIGNETSPIKKPVKVAQAVSTIRQNPKDRRLLHGIVCK